MNEIISYILCAVLAYLLGSLSFGVIISKLRYRDDIRRHGSGNAGATNALRTYGKLSAVLVLLGDFLKGTLAVLIGQQMGADVALGGMIAGLFAVLGHLFPVYFRFKGGKGVATAAGTILMLNPLVLVALVIPFVLIIALSRYVSLGSVSVAVLYPVFTLVAGLLQKNPNTILATVFAAVVGGLVAWMHRSNIKRLIAGTESKLGGKKKE
ncbi:MAG: glycerol-3-phosphate 1-O-acyltransferase PlsY [Angelakisella sp.]|nr:glycerol-3-phosphate 1-O-acyltransferase PlsY [Angelakisella sp.]